MLDTTGAIWQQDTTRQFAATLTSIKDAQTMQNFLRDIMTQKEITEMSARLEAARQLQRGETYTDIVASTRLSSRTVARISEWMKDGCGGYAEILKEDSDA